jgi:hypothetical protein
MNLEQLIADAIQVTNYLRRRFGQEKIYLKGFYAFPLWPAPTASRTPDSAPAWKLPSYGSW